MKRTKLVELGNSDLGSLDRLSAAMGKWLDESEKEKMTSSTWTRENGFRAENFDRMDTASMPLDGKLVSRRSLSKFTLMKRTGINVTIEVKTRTNLRYLP